MIVVATKEEEAKAREIFPKAKIVKTGVGGCNVIEALSGFDRDVEIINYGYVGSNCLPVGAKVSISSCKQYHPTVEYDEKVYKLDGDYPCYTSGDFVTSTNINEPCVFDMELAYIMALGFKNVRSIKVVSDSMNLSEYERNVVNG